MTGFLLLLVFATDSGVPAVQQLGPYRSAQECDAVRGNIEDMVRNTLVDPSKPSGLQSRCIPPVTQ